MKYTIKEISLAWDKFTQPKYLVDSKRVIDVDLLKPEGIIEYEEGVKLLSIDYSRWIPYLISEEWRELTTNNTKV